MLGISNSLFNYCNVTITLYAYILVCFLVPLAPKLLVIFGTIIIFTGQNYWGDSRPPCPPPLVSATVNNYTKLKPWVLEIQAM